MYDTASPTVLRFCTSLSGILTPNFSSAATTTSTIDSESTSRSSVKDFSSATSSGFTPATSSRISARPGTISSRVLSCISFPFGRRFNGWSGAPDDLSGVGEAAAEAEQEHRRPGGHLAALDELRQGQRHAGRGGVARLDDVLGDDGVGQVEATGDALDDPGVGLVRHEGLDVGRLVAGPLDHFERLGRQFGGGPAEYRLALLLHVRPPALDADGVAALGDRTPQHRADPGPLAF